MLGALGVDGDALRRGEEDLPYIVQGGVRLRLRLRLGLRLGLGVGLRLGRRLGLRLGRRLRRGLRLRLGAGLTLL